MNKTKLFTQPTKLGTEIYAYKKFEDFIEGGRNIYEIVHLNLEEKEELLKCLILDRCLKEEAQIVLYKEIATITNIFDIAAEEGQRTLKLKDKQAI